MVGVDGKDRGQFRLDSLTFDETELPIQVKSSLNRWL